MNKFRRMNIIASDFHNPNDPAYSAEDDPTVANAGKILGLFSVDELPQLISVLTADICVIGQSIQGQA
jgi:lipopolysaccharide/colanic/teichoic acid biosynthesis glycosyltransferase